MPWPTTSRHARGYGSEWDKLRLRVLERDCHLCQRCRERDRWKAGNIVDHKKPKAQGGTDDMANLWTLCKDCDDEKQLIDRGITLKQQIGADGWPIDP